jgi:membrane protease YdiL (CAAX protease family)
MSTTTPEPSGSEIPPVAAELQGPVFQTAPPPELWRLRDLGFFIAYAMFTLMLAPFLLLMVYAILQPLAHWRTTATVAATQPIFAVAAQAVSYVMILAFVYVLVAVHYGLPFWTALKWRRLGVSRGSRLFLGGIAMAFFVLGASSLLPDKKPFPLEQMFNSPASAYTVAAFAILAAPFMEELIFRGVLFTFFERHAGLGFAVISTALLFAALHVPEYWGAWNHVLLILMVGFIFSLARGTTDSLAPSVILHVAYNAALMVMLFFATHHFRTIQAVAAR